MWCIEHADAVGIYTNFCLTLFSQGFCNIIECRLNVLEARYGIGNFLGYGQALN